MEHAQRAVELSAEYRIDNGVLILILMEHAQRGERHGLNSVELSAES